QDDTRKIINQRKLTKARRFIIDRLGIDENEKLTKKIIKERLTALYKSLKEVDQFINSVISEFSHSDPAVRILLEAYNEINLSGDK
ncbi:MAG: hypothetical protein DI557_23925, partial [Serratia marcescens]